MFYDYWLKGNTQFQIETLLKNADIDLLPTSISSYDPIGIIYTDGSEIDQNGNFIQVPLEGWHANLRLRIPLSEQQQNILQPILIERPNNPSRIWA